MARPAPRQLLRQVLLTGLGAALLTLIPWHLGLWERWEAKTWDMRAAWMAKPGPATEDIVLILLDQQSLDWGQEQSGLSWPWPREVYGVVVDFCRRSQVRTMAMDVLFLEPSAYGVDDDLALARALREYSKTASALFLSHGETGGLTAWPEDIPVTSLALQGHVAGDARLPGPTAARVSLPVPELARASSVLGNVQLRPDPDGVFRRLRPLTVFDGRVIPALGLAAFMADNPDTIWRFTDRNLALHSHSIPLDSDGRALLRFRGPSGTHRAYSAAAVLQSELRLREGLEPTINPGELTNKYVLFGFSAPGLFDLRPTPVGGIYPGVEIQATFLDNFLSHDFLRNASMAVVTALVLGFSLLTALVLALFRAPLIGAVIGAVMLAAPLALALFAYKWGYWLPMVVQETGVAGAALLGLLYNYSTEGRQRRFIKGAFQQYLSPQVIEQLIAHPEKLKLGGERKVLTIFFSDLQGFTSISENLAPEALTSLLNDYLSAMTEIIHQEQGTVDKYEGDAIIAFWNAPVDVPNHALHAVRAAVHCQSRLAELRPVFRQRTGHDLYMRIGINTGLAVVGNMGSHNRFDYSMLGDAVNLAARLEGVNKQFNTYTMVSQTTKDAVGDAVPMRELGRVAVVGRKEPVTVFEPLSEEFARINAPTLERFDRGLRAYYQGSFGEAAQIFSTLAKDDPVAAKYLDVCRDLPPEPPEEWDGVWRMSTK
ncbi:MAG TPA: adenylate/guanylate cyclase domain-containing protein [Desulfonatronum sp.]|nr:adenylate/guanylate cyclase domain-containing protein [Desulfonatronum sp.]